MPDTIYIGNFAKGLTTNPLPFNIDNDAFPNMYNFYSWRGRAKKKRGTLFLGRLQRQIERVLNATPPNVYQFGQLKLSSGSGNLFVSTVTSPGITNATNAVITTKGHIFHIGDVVTISGVTGMVGINGIRTVVQKTADTITVDYDSSLDPVYVSGGTIVFTFENPSVVPDSINITDNNTGNVYTEPATFDGTLLNNGVADGSTINYATGVIFIVGGSSHNLIGTYSIYPLLPALGTADISITPSTSNYPALLAFDQFYSYQCDQANTNARFFVTSYYKMSKVPFRWSGGDFQQFWTTNYLGALWATNGKPGLHFVNGTYVAGASPGLVFTFTFTSNGVAFQNLVVNDVLWFNEWEMGGSDVNGKTGIVTNNASAATGTYEVTFSSAVTVSGTGIAQLLTNSIQGKDGVKWYNGDPTNNTGLPTNANNGWVNFAPPLTLSETEIDNLPSDKYYLIGALVILPFKDRLLFFNPTIGNSSGSEFNIEDGVIWSQNGTPYYTVDASGDKSLVPDKQTATLNAWYIDQTGLGGWRTAGISNPLKTVGTNEDALIVGFGGDGVKARFVYTGNDFDPFLFFLINSELPSSSTFSVVNLDAGMLDIGAYGICITDQQSARRIDLPIPDSIFQIQNENNGVDRVNGIRDFFREWVYFCYPLNTSISGTTANLTYTFPTQTLIYNYRDNTWGYFYENFTTQGYYRSSKKKTWATLPWKTWSAWREPWNSGSGSQLFPSVIAGTPQGFYLIKSQGTQESPCCAILDIQNNGGYCQITSPNHCVSSANPNVGGGDYLQFSNAIGLKSFSILDITLGTTTVITCFNSLSTDDLVTISGVVGTTELNGNTYRVISQNLAAITIDVDSSNFTPWESGGLVTSAFNGLIGRVVNVIDINNFVVDIAFPQFSTVYLGLGTFSKLCLPLLQTKQFPFYWNEGRQVRLCTQKYLMDYTANSQCTVQIYLSQDPDLDYADPIQVPPPNALIYSEVLYTCPESANIGLTPSNTNLQMPTAEGQYQIWHRSNTSLIGDSVQIGITLSDAQMRDKVFSQAEITLHGMCLVLQKGPHLS